MPQITQQFAETISIPERPKSWVLESIIVMLVLMFPCGLVALIFASKVNKHYNAGNYEKSIRMSRLANRWNTIGLWTGIPLTIFHIFFWDDFIKWFDQFLTV